MKKHDAEVEEQMRSFFEKLSEKEKRHYAAIEASKAGYGGQRYIANVLGCSTRTIQRGQAELALGEELVAAGRNRRLGGGRKPFDKKKLFECSISQGNRDIYSGRPDG